MLGLLLSSDLMFTSRIVSMAKQAGFRIQVATTADGLLAQVSPEVSLVMVDLFRRPASELATLVAALRQHDPHAHIVAYGPHVDESLLQQAREAGCHEVLTRGQFNQQIGELLRRWLADAP